MWHRVIISETSMKKMVKYDDGLVFYLQWQILQTYHEKNISMRYESCFVLDQQNESSFFKWQVHNVCRKAGQPTQDWANQSFLLPLKAVSLTKNQQMSILKAWVWSWRRNIQKTYSRIECYQKTTIAVISMWVQCRAFSNEQTHHTSAL